MDAARLRTAFPILRHTAYLNAGTTGPVSEAAWRAGSEALRLAAEEGRGIGFYTRLRELADRLRTRYARLLGGEPADVALTAGTSDGVGRIVAGLELGPGDEILTADDEHPGLQGPLLAARLQRGVAIRAVPLAEVAAEVGPATRLVACSHVSWCSGAFAPDLRAAARNVPVLLDGAQGVGAVPVDVRALGVQFYAGSGQKWLCGPIGTGALWVAPDWQERVRALAPHYGTLATPSAGLESELAPAARRFDAPSPDLGEVAAAMAAYDVLDEAGWPAIHERAIALAARLADRLAERGHEVAPRGPSTLVSWAAGDDDAALATRERLLTAGVVVRDLPGTGRLRASVGAWNDDDDLERLIIALAA